MTYYDDISEGYEELHREEQLKKIELIKTFFEPKPKNKLLDVGCGTGLTTVPWNCIRYGIDPAIKLLDRARHKKKITYKLAQAESIPYPDKYFDHVISITAIQNFEDIKKGLTEMKRVGKNSFVLSYLKKSNKAGEIETHIDTLFSVKNRIVEEKDVIYLCGSKPSFFQY